MKLYKSKISGILKEIDRISFGQLKKDIKDYLRLKGHEKIDFLDVQAPNILVQMIGEGEVATICEDEKCNETFGDSNVLPICDKCVIYPLRKSSGFMKAANGELLLDINDEIPYDLRSF